MRKITLFLISLSLILILGNIRADVVLPKILSSNMVLQRNALVPIWGHAARNENVKISFAGQILNTVADSDGHWEVILRPLKIANQPSDMIISGNNTIILSNILVGDVWLCSGQSNMEYPLDRTLKKYTAPTKGADVATDELSKPKPDRIRYIYAEKQRDTKDIKSAGWITGANDSILKNVTATGYFFAKEIYEQTQIPIGIISTAWGGTRIEEWTPAWAYANSQVFKECAKEKNFKIDSITPGLKFESMLKPIVPFAVKGMLWYQGESNCTIEDQKTYPEKFRILLETYRTLFRNSQMPCYYVQIAPHAYSRRKKDKQQHNTELLPEFWEAQTSCLSIPNTAMTVSTDLVDNLNNIHPSYKWIVGHRLALCALAKDYDKSVVYSGPIYKSMVVKENKIILSFENIGGGLVSNDSLALSWFTIAGADKNFVIANSEIDGNKVIVWADSVKKPLAVHFAWNEGAIPNLFNKEGLPAVPFRTDK